MSTTPLYTLHRLQQILNLKVEGPDCAITGISFDTRTLQRGDLFVALTGKRDGHAFVPQAASGGAAAVLVSKPVSGWAIPQLVVRDTLVALNIIAAARRDEVKAKRIAITGSCGKTTTKEMLGLALAPFGKVHRADSSFNNHIGVPYSLATMPVDTDFGVFEIGMNKPGEIAPLSQLVRPDVAVLTLVAPAHIGAFSSIEGIAEEKLYISAGLSASGTLVVRRRVIDTFSHLISHVQFERLTFAPKLNSSADVKLLGATPAGDGTQVHIDISGTQVNLFTPTPDEPTLNSALAALSAVHALGLDVKKAADALSKYRHPLGRGGVVQAGGISIIDQSYNANPASMREALRNLAKHPTTGRRVALLGDMLELGTRSENYHRSMVFDIKGIDAFYTVGTSIKAFSQELSATQKLGHTDSPEAFDVAAFARLLKQNDVLLVKASNGILYRHGVVKKLVEILTNNAAAA